MMVALATMAGLAGCKPAASAGVKPYPLKVCIVSGEELGSMGEGSSEVYQGQEIKFCCAKCQPKFDADPQKFLAKLAGH